MIAQIGVNMIALSRSAARQISKLSNRLRRKIEMLSSRKEFSGSQGKILHFLLAQVEDVFQKDIEEEYGIRPSSATELLKQMEKNELIIREPAEYDNRLKRIVLTPKALLYREQVIEDLTALEESLVRGIPKDKMKIFFEVVQKMMDNVSD